MAKKTSFKNQIFQQIANQQVQQVLNQQREQQTANLMADFNSFMEQQQNPEALMADFNSWKEQNKQPVQSVSQPTVQNNPTEWAVDRSIYIDRPGDKYNKAKAAEAISKRQAFLENRKRNQGLIPSIADLASENVSNAFKEPVNKVELKAEEKKKIGQRPEATDFSSQVAARPVDRETIIRGGKKWNESVNNTLNMLNSKEIKDVNAYQKLVQANEAKAAVENEQEAPAINSSINQLDLSQYNLPEEGISEQDRKAFDDYSKATQWLDTNYRMTKDEQKEAKRIAYEGKQALAEKYPVTNKADYGKLLDRMTPEDREKYLAFEDLGNKADSLASFSVGAADEAVKMGGGLFNTYALFHPFNPNAARSAKAYKELVQDNWNEKAEGMKELAQNATPLAENVPVIGEITPYGAGKTAAQMGAYLATNDAFDELGSMVLGDGKVAGFLGNQIGQNLQDVFLDTIPRYNELKAQGYSKEEIRDILTKEGLMNAAGNGLFGGALEIPGLVKSGIDNVTAKKAADAAFRENVRAGADNLSRIANEIPGIEDADNITRNTVRQIEDSENVVRNAARQAEEATQNIEPEPVKETVKDPVKAVKPEYVIDSITRKNRNGDKIAQYFAREKYSGRRVNPFLESDTPEDAIRVANNTFNFMMDTDEGFSQSVKEAWQKNGIIAPSDIEPEPVKEMVEEVAKRGPELSAETQEQIASDFEEIYKAMEDMRNVVESSGSQKVADKYEKLQQAVFKYEDLTYNSESLEEINKAKKAADAARQGFIREVKKIDPNFKGSLTGTKLGNAEFRRTSTAPTDSALLDEIVDDMVKQDMDNPKRFIRDAKPDSTNVYRGVEPDTPIVNNTQIDSKALRKETNNMKTSFREKAKYLRDSDNPYAKKFLNSIDEFTNNPSVDTYRKMVSAHDDYIGNYNKDVWKSSNSGYYHPEYHSEQITKRLDDIAEKYGFKNSADNKVMAEDIGISKQPKSDIITSEPIEPGKYEIPDTPENAPIDVPPVDGMKERGTSRHIRNDGTPMRMEGVSDEVVSDFKDNPDMYKVLKNSDTLSKAEKIYNESSDALVDFRDMVRNHDPAALPLGHQLAKDYSAAGNHEAAAQIYREMGEQLTKAGQFSQAAAINMMKNDPLTARAYFERELDALNKAGADKYGKKWKDFVLTDEERAMFDKIAPGDSEAIKKAIDKIGVRIEKEYPASAWEKVLEFRRVAMLFNTRTIVRNTLANPPTAGLRYVSDRIEALGQYIAHLIKPEFEVTQAIRGSNLETRKLAKEIYNSSKVKSLLEGGTGRLSEIPSVGDYARSKQMFKGGFVSDWVNKMTNGGVEKLNAKLGKENAKSLLELTRSSAYKALEVTDNPMVRENFISRLGSYIRAKGIKNAADVPDEAILMAYEEAMKATYKDNSFMVQAIRNFKSGIERTGNHIIPGLGDMASQALIPYVQAPGNIAARTIDYSGIGFTKGIAKIVKGATANDVKMISKGIEEASKGATGTLMAALGYALYKSGVITGTYSNDNDQKAFEKKNGFREFAFRYKVNGQTKYDTIDWMQPFVDTIMPGVLLAQAIENSDEYDSDILRYFGFEGTKLGKVTGVVKEGVKKNVNYFFDSTPLKNLGELFKGNYGKETDLAGNLWENTVEDFASALVPAGVNAVTKSVDPIQRQTYDPSNAFGTFVNGVAAKLPKVSEALPVKYDTWGQPMTYGNSKGEAAFAKMLYPGEHTSDKADETDKELNRLFETTSNNAVFPQVAPNKVDGEKLNNKEVSQYQQDVGVRNKLLVDNFIKSSIYDSLDDADKAEKIAKLYGASKAITERDKFGKELADNSEYKKAIEAYDNAGGGEKGAKAIVDYYNAKAIADASGLSSSSNAYKEIMNTALTGDEKEANKLVEENKTANDMYAKYNLTGDENAAAVYNKAGENGLKYYSNFKSKGLTDYRAALTYDSATKEIKDKSKLPTMDDFVRGYKKIDSYGKSNGHVDQTEFLSFLNDGNYSDEQAAYYATLYGDWTTAPKISTRGKNKGKWIFG